MKIKKQIECREDGFGKQWKVAETEYDKQGNTIWTIVYHDTGEILQEGEYNYKDGKLVEESYY